MIRAFISIALGLIPAVLSAETFSLPSTSWPTSPLRTSIETNAPVYVPDPRSVRFPIRRVYVEFSETDIFSPEPPYAAIELTYPVGYCVETAFVACPANLTISPDWVPRFIEAPVGTAIRITIRSANGQELPRQFSGCGGDWGSGCQFTMDFLDSRVKVGGTTTAKSFGYLALKSERSYAWAFPLAELKRRLVPIDLETAQDIEAQKPPRPDVIEKSPSAFEVMALLKKWRTAAMEWGASIDELPVHSAIVFAQETKSLTVDGGIFGSVFGKKVVTLNRAFNPYLLLRVMVPNPSLSQGSNPSKVLSWLVVRFYYWKHEASQQYNGEVTPERSYWAPFTVSSEPKAGTVNNPEQTMFDILFERTRTLSDPVEGTKSVRAVLDPMVFPGSFTPETITQFLEGDFKLLDAQRNLATLEFVAGFVPLYDAAQKAADGAGVGEIVLSAAVDTASLAVGGKGVISVAGKKIYVDAVARTTLKLAASAKVVRTCFRAHESIKKNGLTGMVALSVAADVVDTALTGLNAYEGLADAKRFRSRIDLTHAEAGVFTGPVGEGISDGLRGQSLVIGKDQMPIPTGLGGADSIDNVKPSTISWSVAGAARTVCVAPGKLASAGKLMLNKMDDFVYQSLRHLRMVDRGLIPMGRDRIRAKPVGSPEYVKFEHNYDNVFQAFSKRNAEDEFIRISPDDIAVGDFVNIEGADHVVHGGIFDGFTRPGSERAIRIRDLDGAVVEVPLRKSDVFSYRLEIEIALDGGVKRVDVYIPAKADGKFDEEMAEWIQQTLSVMPAEMVANNAKIYLYSGKQGTSGQFGTRFFGHHGNNEWDDNFSVKGNVDWETKNISIFPDAFDDRWSLASINGWKKAYREKLISPASNWRLQAASETIMHEAGHALSIEIAENALGRPAKDLVERQTTFVDIWRKKLAEKNVNDMSISGYADNYFRRYIDRYGRNPETSPKGFRLVMLENFAEVVRLRVLHEIEPLSAVKYQQMKPFFDSLDELVDVHCANGLFDGVMRAFRRTNILPSYMTLTSSRILSDAARAANEPDAEEAQFQVFYANDGSVGMVGFENRENSAPGPTRPPSQPTMPPPNPAVEGPDCTNLDLIARDDCTRERSLVCREYDEVKKLTSDQGYTVYQVHPKGYAEQYHWDYACTTGRGALYFGFLGKDNNWYATGETLNGRGRLVYSDTGPSGVPAWGSMFMWMAPTFPISFWFDLR